MDKNIKISDNEIEAIEEVLTFCVKSQSVVTLFCCTTPDNPLFDLKRVMQLGKYVSTVDDFINKVKGESK